MTDSIFPFTRSDFCTMGQKTAADKGKKEIAVVKSKKTAGRARPPVQKSTLEANWSNSWVTDAFLKEMVIEGILPPHSEIEWRGPGEETRPQPKTGEVVVFADHITRG